MKFNDVLRTFREASSKATSFEYGLFLGLRANSFQIFQDKRVQYMSQSATHCMEIQSLPISAGRLVRDAMHTLLGEDGNANITSRSSQTHPNLY